MRPSLRLVLLAGAVALTVPLTALPAGAAGPSTSAVLAQQIPIGAGVHLGGFSDLYPRDGSGRHFWTVTDRGPNYDRDDGQGFVVPEFTPRILAVDVAGGRMTISRQIPVRLPPGVADPITGSSYVSGLPNLATDSPGFDVSGNQLPLDPYGIDSEGLLRAPDGSFWVSEEYRPSVLHVAADGTVLSRLVPSDQTGYRAPGIAVRRVLPAILSQEKSNRGLEALAISGDGTTLYAGMQSPLDNPSSKSSRNLRIVRIDISRPARPVVTGEYVNVRDADGADDGDWETSSMTWLGTDRLLVEERDGAVPTEHTDFYAVDLSGATNILGSVWDSSATSPTLEELDPAGLGAHHVVAGAKRLVLDVPSAGTTNGKLEGVAIAPHGTVVGLSVLNDNDFDVAGVDSSGQVSFTDVPEQLDTYRLPRVQVFGSRP